MGRRKLYLSLILAGGCASAWLGFRGEQERQQTGETAPAPLKAQLKRIFVRPTDAVTRLNEIRGHAKRVDLSPPEEDECWQIIRGFSVEQIRSYLADLPTDRPNAAAGTLIKMLFSRWAQLDPFDALAEAKKPEYTRNGAVIAAFTSWAGRDLASALNWTNGPEGIDMKYYAADIAARMYFQEDPSTAIERIKSQLPDALPDVFRNMARKTDGTDESLRQYFERTRSEGTAAISGGCCWDLAQNWTKRDVSHALESNETFGLTPDQLSQFRTNVLMAASQSEPVTVLNRLQQGQETALEPGNRERTLVSIIMSHPEQGVEWAVENHQTDLLVQGMDRQLASLERSKRPLADSLGILRGHYQSWSESSPATADAWLQKQSDEVRKALTAMPSNASH